MAEFCWRREQQGQAKNSSHSTSKSIRIKCKCKCKYKQNVIRIQTNEHNKHSITSTISNPTMAEVTTHLIALVQQYCNEEKLAGDWKWYLTLPKSLSVVHYYFKVYHMGSGSWEMTWRLQLINLGIPSSTSLLYWSKPWLVVSSLIKIQPSELFVSQRLIPIPNKMEQRYSILVAILVNLLKGSGTISRKPINLTSSILCCLPTSRSGRKRLGHQDRLVCYEFFRWWWS